MHDLPSSTAEWQRIPPTRVELASVVAVQNVRDEWVADKARRWWTSHSGDVYVHLERTTDGYRVVDGHHRIEHWRRHGHRYVWARVFTPT